MHPIHVLIVDDKRRHLDQIAQQAKQTVARHGLTNAVWHTASTLKKALHIVRSQPVNVALIDLSLNPDNAHDFSGVKIAIELKRRNPYAETVLVTAHMREATVEQVDLSAFEGRVVEKSGDYLTRTLPKMLSRCVWKHVGLFNRDQFCRHERMRSNKMWVLGLNTKATGLQYYRAPIPTMPDDAILLQTVSLGVCGTDIESFGGDSVAPYDLVEFHEAVGRVVWTGSNVETTKYEVGDLVVPIVRRCQTWRPPVSRTGIDACDFSFDDCRLASRCESYRRPDACPRGEFPISYQGEEVGYRSRGTGRCHGFGSEFFVDTPDWLVRVLPKDAIRRYPLNYLKRLILVEPLSVVWKMKREVERVRRIRPFEDRMLTLGMGPIGYLATILMQTMNPGLRCVAVDRMASQRPWIQNLETDFVPKIQYHCMKHDETWHSALAGQKFDLIVEATGAPQKLIGSAIDALAPNGVLVLLSVVGKEGDSRVDIEPADIERIVKKNGIIVGSVNESRFDFENAVRFLEAFHSKNSSPLDKLMTRFKIDSKVVARVTAVKDHRHDWAKRRAAPKLVLDALDKVTGNSNRTVLDVLAGPDLSGGEEMI